MVQPSMWGTSARLRILQYDACRRLKSAETGQASSAQEAGQLREKLHEQQDYHRAETASLEAGHQEAMQQQADALVCMLLEMISAVEWSHVSFAPDACAASCCIAAEGSNDPVSTCCQSIVFSKHCFSVHMHIVLRPCLRPRRLVHA